MPIGQMTSNSCYLSASGSKICLGTKLVLVKTRMLRALPSGLIQLYLRLKFRSIWSKGWNSLDCRLKSPPRRSRCWTSSRTDTCSCGSSISASLGSSSPSATTDSRWPRSASLETPTSTSSSRLWSRFQVRKFQISFRPKMSWSS